MNIPAPKRYANALLIHFINFSLFLPAFVSNFKHVYYQDFFLSVLIAAFIAFNILFCWKIDLKQNPIPAFLLSAGVILYNCAYAYMYRTATERYQWKSDQHNITLTFIFFIALLFAKDIKNIISEKILRWTIRALVATNLIAVFLRICGYSHIQLGFFSFTLVPVDETNRFLGWFCTDAGEYAFLLLLAMGLFLVYKDLFINKWTYLLSQLLLMICLLLTNSATFLLAAAILWGFQLVQYVINRYHIPQKYVYFSFPCTISLCIVALIFLFNKVELFVTQSRIMNGTWRMLNNEPSGFSVAFGALTYYVDGIKTSLFQANNVFLNHMLRHSLQVGIVFTALFVITFLCAFFRNPNYRTFGILCALMLVLNFSYSLQTVHMPICLYMIYCIFFRPSKATEESAVDTSKVQPKHDPIPDLELLDLDEESIERRD